MLSLRVPCVVSPPRTPQSPPAAAAPSQGEYRGTGAMGSQAGHMTPEYREAAYIRQYVEWGSCTEGGVDCVVRVRVGLVPWVRGAAGAPFSFFSECDNVGARCP